MFPTVTTKIAITAAGLVLAGTAVAAAVGAPPEAADKGLTTAEEHTGFPVPVRAGGHVEDDELDDEVIDEPAEVGDDEGDEVDGEDVEEQDEPGDDAGGPVDNHGAAVSAVAQDDSLTGREHGQAVSEVAQSDAGKPDHDGDDDEAERPGNGAGRGKGPGKP